MSELIRLNKYLAHTTGISRREADEYISRGRVLINGTPAILGATIDPASVKISIDGNAVSTAVKNYTYLLLNKPVGYICSRRQQADTPTIYALLPPQYHDLKVAGRLDKDSCGLLLLTDDGDTIFHLTHPKFHKQKTYLVSLNASLSEEDQQAIQKGVQLEDGVSKFVIELTKSDTENQPPNTYSALLSEGRNRQIRRTFKALDYQVIALKRTDLGPYHIDDLQPGQFKEVPFFKKDFKS